MLHCNASSSQVVACAVLLAAAPPTLPNTVEAATSNSTGFVRSEEILFLPNPRYILDSVTVMVYITIGGIGGNLHMNRRGTALRHERKTTRPAKGSRYRWNIQGALQSE